MALVDIHATHIGLGRPKNTPKQSQNPQKLPKNGHFPSCRLYKDGEGVTISNPIFERGKVRGPGMLHKPTWLGEQETVPRPSTTPNQNSRNKAENSHQQQFHRVGEDRGENQALRRPPNQ